MSQVFRNLFYCHNSVFHVSTFFSVLSCLCMTDAEQHDKTDIFDALRMSQCLHVLRQRDFLAQTICLKTVFALSKYLKDPDDVFVFLLHWMGPFLGFPM